MPDDIGSAFEAGKRRASRASVIEAPDAHERGKQMVREASESREYLAAAEQLGFAYQIAYKHQLAGEQFDILDVVGAIYARYPSIDADVASIEASKWMRRAGRGFASIGKTSRAAIAYTNAAVALMEKSAISEAELRVIKQLVDFGFEHKMPGSVDWGYSEGALGMYYSELRSDSSSELIANLELSRAAHMRALEIFSAHGEAVPVGSLSSISRVDRDLYRAKRRERVVQVLLEHISELPVAAQRWASDIPSMIADNIQNNPAVYGFDVVPSWLSEVADAPPSDEDATMLRTARDRLIAAVEDAPESDYTARLDCRWRAAEIDVDLLSVDEAYRNFLYLLTTYADDFIPEQFIRRASRVVGMARYLRERPPVELLLKIATAFDEISVGQRDMKRLEVFLRRNPAHMRFVACELCEHGLWNDAVSVIEKSRVLLHAEQAQESRESDLPSSDLDDTPHWVYVTHSPNGTYVILGSEYEEGSAYGVHLPEIDGARLSELHFSFADDSVGLMHAQSGGMRSQLTTATARAFEILEPLSQAIRGLVPNDRGVCLIVGGLYVTLPVSASLGAVESARYPYVVVVPSRAQTVAKRYSLPLSDHLRATAMSASSAPYIPDLPFLTLPDHEVASITNFLSAASVRASVVTDASVQDLESAFQRENIIHFSGHSIGTPFEPEYSSLLLSDGPYSVSHILGHAPLRNMLLASISSCQSGYQSTTVLADEVLGINSALLYRGCRFTLSTLWPMHDVASYLTMSRFYDELRRRDTISIESLYQCLANTQSWIRTSTTAEILGFLQSNGLQVPAILARFAPDAVSFDHPRVWAAFYLSSRSL